MVGLKGENISLYKVVGLKGLIYLLISGRFEWVRISLYKAVGLKGEVYHFIKW